MGRLALSQLGHQRLLAVERAAGLPALAARAFAVAAFGPCLAFVARLELAASPGSLVDLTQAEVPQAAEAAYK